MVLKDHHCQRATFFLIFFSLLLCNQANAVHGDRFSLASQFLGPHNAVRSALRMPSLVWDPRVARYAQWYANQRRRDCALKHSNGPYGENIFWGSGTGWTPAHAVTAWAGERKWYKYWSNDCALGRECGHYTQMIWRTTRRLGCAKVTCSGGKGIFMVCNYDPPGNYIGERPY
ncbi:pathogenesis-related protein PR-1-like [Aristolochia californica]|uniref:pathogenesis-related protein PR-1-like n=1 Tax=Aristolochia californica TaxID=171875 RepID=UPI0035D5F0C0